jgi:O-antigen/teichoic acid export membrane protein
MNTIQRIAKNASSLLISGVVAQVLGFFAVVYLARVLGPSDFGKITFATAIITYFTMATHLGLPILGIREIARDTSRINDYFANIIAVRLCLAALGYALLVLLVFLLHKPLALKKLLLLYGIGLFFSALTIDWIFQGTERMEYIGIGRILSAAVYSGLVFLLVRGREQLFFVPYSQVAGMSIAVLVLLGAFIRHFGKPRFELHPPRCRNILRQSMPVGIAIIMIQVIYNVDTVMLGFMRSDAEIGYYNAAYKIILPLIMVGSIYFDAVFPVISNYFETSRESLQRLQSFNAKLVTIVVFPLSIGGTFLAQPIMNLVYGSRYDNGVSAFQILLWAVALIYINSLYARGLWACNKQNQFLKIVVAQALTNIVLNLFLIPRFGIVGASISTVFAEFMGFFLYYREFNKVISTTIHQFIFRPALASLVMLSFLVLFKTLHLLLLIFFSIAIYLLSLYGIKGITKSDIRDITKVLGLTGAS